MGDDVEEFVESYLEAFPLANEVLVNHVPPGSPVPIVFGKKLDVRGVTVSMGGGIPSRSYKVQGKQIQAGDQINIQLIYKDPTGNDHVHNIPGSLVCPILADDIEVNLQVNGQGKMELKQHHSDDEDLKQIRLRDERISELMGTLIEASNQIDELEARVKDLSSFSDPTEEVRLD